jgi:hypothetical protein
MINTNSKSNEFPKIRSKKVTFLKLLFEVIQRNDSYLNLINKKKKNKELFSVNKTHN